VVEERRLAAIGAALQLNVMKDEERPPAIELRQTARSGLDVRDVIGNLDDGTDRTGKCWFCHVRSCL
jgi:hypothetical protein